MGNVKDRYFKYAENGDQYVGRCLAMLPMQKIELAISPPYFSSKTDLEWVSSMVNIQFSAMKSLHHFGKMLRQCLASLLYHHGWIEEFLGFNHVVKTSSVCFRSLADIKRVEEGGWVVVTFPWSSGTDFVFSGIPPHCTVLQHIAEVRSEQRSFCENFVSKIKEALTEYGVNSGALSEERVSHIMQEFYQKFEAQLGR
jgi:hypothetical protein